MEQDAKRMKKVEHRVQRRQKIMQDEATRWQDYDTRTKENKQYWDDVRATSLKAKANLSSLPYDPVTLRTKDSIDGLQYEYEEGLMKYREQLRSKNLYGKYNANGYNPIDGRPLFKGDMPQRPMNVSQLAQQKDEKKRLDVVALLKNKILERGGRNGVRILARYFRQMDANGNGILSSDELLDALSKFGISGLSVAQVDNILSAVDTTGDGSISIDEFMNFVRGPMKLERLNVVRQAWAVLDDTNDGAVTVQDMLGKYDVSGHPRVREGRMSQEEAIQEFMKVWDKSADGVITWDEFVSYYRDLGAGIDSDVFFEQMVRNAWRLSGGEGDNLNTSRQRVLLVHKSGQMTLREVPGPIISSALPPAARLNEIKRRFRDAGVQFMDIRFAE